MTRPSGEGGTGQRPSRHHPGWEPFSGADDDSTTSSYHYYAGYRSVFAWEWYVQDATTHEKDPQPVKLCACVGANNALVYEEQTGLNACSQ